MACLAGAALKAEDGTTVQLPTFNFTTVNTTVTIPDGGSVTLGGIDRVAEGRTERGVPILGKIPFLNRAFKNVGIGREVSSSRMRATAKILILDELEKDVMDQAADSRAARGDRRTFEEMVRDHQALEVLRQQDADLRKAEYLSRHVDQAAIQNTSAIRNISAPPYTAEQRFAPPEAAPPQLPDIEAIRQRNEAAKELRDAEAVAYFEQGQAAENSGKAGAARVYYKMALRRANGQFKTDVQSRLDALDGAEK